MSINLLPWREQLKKKKIHSFLMQILVVIFLSMFICVIFYIKEHQHMINKKQKVEGLKDQMSLAYFWNKDFLNFISSKNGQKTIDFLEHRKDRNNMLTSMLFWIGEHIPNTIYLNKIESRSESIYIYGKSFSQLDVLSFVKQFEDDLPIKKISIDEVNRVENEDYQIDFVISLV